MNMTRNELGDSGAAQTDDQTYKEIENASKKEPAKKRKPDNTQFRLPFDGK